MRNLNIQASAWVDCRPEAVVTTSHGETVLALECAESEAFHYQCLGIERAGEVFWYLYAWNEASSWVLGVFDTRGQVDFFLALHSDNPLKVPALALAVSGVPVRVERGRLMYPRYAGVYRVGFKSYRVEADHLDADLLGMHYVDRYNSQFLGVAGEKEACLAIYSHFDSRLRGCKMC